MFVQTLAIIRNTFLESIRQPIMLVLLVIATIGLIASNALSGYTMEDDQRMLIDMGLSTVFLCGTLITAFVAANVLTREIENKTVLTVVSKPVPRPIFILGKFLGVAAALTLATAYMGFVFLLVELHGALQTVRDPYHGPVLVFSIGAVILGLGAGVWCNYFYNKVFASTAVLVTTPLMGLAYFLSLMFDAHFSPHWIGTSFKGQILIALAALLLAILVLTAVAIAGSTRLSQVMTLLLTLGVFMLGMLSDHFFGRPIHALEQTWLSRAQIAGQAHMEDVTRTIALVGGNSDSITEHQLVATAPLMDFATGAEKLQCAGWWCAYAAVPNFQVFWLSDALTQNHVIPMHYVWKAVAYGVLYILVALSLATILFQRREVG